MVNPMQLEYIDLGGGFGYAPAGIPVAMPTFQEYAAAISDEFERTKPGLRALKIIIEPGLALFNDSVSIVAAVRARKSIGGAQLVVVDASVHTIKPTRHSVNLPTAAFDAAGRPKQGPTHQYDVVGYTCLEDDVIARGLQLPSLEVGDLLVIDGVGAYTYVLKPPFIQPRPAFYMWDGTGTHLIRKAECIADIFGAFGE
jgi:diaminopimelate decarboxylase